MSRGSLTNYSTSLVDESVNSMISFLLPSSVVLLSLENNLLHTMFCGNKYKQVTGYRQSLTPIRIVLLQYSEKSLANLNDTDPKMNQGGLPALTVELKVKLMMEVIEC